MCGLNFKISRSLYDIYVEHTARYVTHLRRIAISFEHSVTLDFNTHSQTLCTVTSVLLAQSLSFLYNYTFKWKYWSLFSLYTSSSHFFVHLFCLRWHYSPLRTWASIMDFFQSAVFDLSFQILIFHLIIPVQSAHGSLYFIVFIVLLQHVHTFVLYPPSVRISKSKTYTILIAELLLIMFCLFFFCFVYRWYSRQLNLLIKIFLPVLCRTCFCI